jgi:NADPH-dependent curcumin reductase CurA
MKVGGNIGKVALFFTMILFLARQLMSQQVASGMISTYNGTSYHIKNLQQVIRRRIKWQGFLAIDPNIVRWTKDRDENITRWIQEGIFKSTDHITEGMDSAVDGFLGMLRGQNNGKSILKIADC